jgi:hypothetical protein
VDGVPSLEKSKYASRSAAQLPNQPKGIPDDFPVFGLRPAICFLSFLAKTRHSGLGKQYNEVRKSTALGFPRDSILGNVLVQKA